MEYYENLSLEDLSEYYEGILIIEKWLPVVGYEGIYEVSSFGRVKSLGNGTHKFPVIIKKQIIGDVGYPILSLCKNGKHKTFRTHRLVALAFIKNPLNKRQVNHIKAIKFDNRVSQLEWATPKEDSRHAYNLGVLKLPSTSWNRGDKNVNSKPVDQYDLKGNYIASFQSLSDAVEKTFIKNINQCVIGNTKTAGGFQWRYKGDKRKLNINPIRYHSGITHFKSKSVFQYTINGKFIKKWGSGSEAGKKTGICIASINKACNNKIKTAGGYIWKFNK